MRTTDLVKEDIDWEDPNYNNEEFTNAYNRVDSYYIDMLQYLDSEKVIHRDNLRYKNENNHIVYFLKDKGEIVYVGQSKRGIGRIFEHGDKIWDSYDYIEVQPRINLDIVEAYYICKFNPILNKSVPVNSKIRNAVFYKIKQNKI